jgi:hypothetical protein
MQAVVNGSVLLGAAAATGLVTACGPGSTCRTEPRGGHLSGAIFGITVHPTPTLRAITYRLNLRRGDTVVRRYIKMQLLRYWYRRRHD